MPGALDPFTAGDQVTASPESFRRVPRLLIGGLLAGGILGAALWGHQGVVADRQHDLHQVQMAQDMERQAAAWVAMSAHDPAHLSPAALASRAPPAGPGVRLIQANGQQATWQLQGLEAAMCVPLMTQLSGAQAPGVTLSAQDLPVGSGDGAWQACQRVADNADLVVRLTRSFDPAGGP